MVNQPVSETQRAVLIPIARHAPRIADSNTPQTTGSANPTEPEASLQNDAPRMTNQLTTFQDQTAQEVSIVPSTQVPIPDPYPDQGMNAVCTRLMKINNFQWSATDIEGTTIGTIDLPNDLLAAESLWCRIGRFRYFRADVEVQIRLNSTKFHYGQLLCYVVPDTTPTEVSTLVTDLWTASQLEPKLLLANSCTELTFTVPYQHQLDLIDVKDSANDPCSLCRIGVVVLAPLQTSSPTADDSLDVTVWARFTNFHIAGPSTIEFTKPTVLDFEKTVLPAHYQPKAKVKTAAKSARQIKPESEQDAKSAQGTTTGIGERIKAFASSFTSVPIIGGIASAASAVGGVLSDLGLNKPDSTRLPQKVLTDAMSNTLQGKGLDNSTALALNPAAHVSDDQNVFGKHDPCCYSFKALAMRPSLFEVRAIPTTTAIGTIVMNYLPRPVPKWSGINTGTRYDNWFAAAARQFLLWRGSVKYMFVFSCSSFTTARFRLTYHPDTVSQNAEANEGGDVISMIIDVKGDTIAKITIPYLNKSPYLRTPRGDTDTAPTANGLLSLSLVNRIIDVDPTIADSAIQLSVWVAGGEDTDFAAPYLPFNPAGSLKITPEGDVLDTFKAVFPPIIKAENKIMKKYCTSESELSIKTYLHRYMYLENTNFAQFFSPTTPYPPYSSTANMSPVWEWFRFRRGSMRFLFSRLPGANPYTSTVYGYTYSINNTLDTTGIASAQSMIYTTTGPDQIHTFVTLPYNASAKFIKVASSATNRGVLVTTPLYTCNNNDSMVSFAAGDDISLGGLATSPTLPA